MEPYGALWNLMEPHGALWSLMEPYGASWSLLETPEGASSLASKQGSLTEFQGAQARARRTAGLHKGSIRPWEHNWNPRAPGFLGNSIGNPGGYFRVIWGP
jgi:hypothetical protein